MIFFILLLLYVVSLGILFMYPNQKNMFLPLGLSGVVALNGVGVTFTSLINGTGDLLTSANGLFYYLLFVVITIGVLFFGEAFNKKESEVQDTSSDINDIWDSL